MCNQNLDGRCRRAPRYAMLFGLLFLPPVARALPGDTPKLTDVQDSPVLVVWAKTDLAQKGAPTLDLQDLERYFVSRLCERGVKNVVPSATARIPRPPATNVFLLELSVDAMQPGLRAKWDDAYKRYEDREVFHVELSLVVKRLASNDVLGSTGERREYDLSYSNMREVAPKRGVLYETADHLANRFISELISEKYGKDLAGSYSSPWKDFEEVFRGQLPRNPNVRKGAVVGAFVGIVLSVVFVLVLIGDRKVRAARLCAELRRAQAAKDVEWHDRVLAAKTKMLETDNFSEAWVRSAAVLKRDELLANAAKIEAAEAERQVNWQRFEAAYEQISAFASRELGLDQGEVKAMLRSADELDFRLLQAAKALKTEEAA